MRVPLRLTIAAVLLSGCFRPELPEKIACDASGECPPDLRCEAAVQLCVDPTVPVVAAMQFKTQLASVEALTDRPTVQVALVDAQGGVVPVSGGSFHLALTPPPTTTTAPVGLAGTLTAVAVEGVIRFDEVQLDRPATGVRLTAQGGSLTATSQPFDVTATRPRGSELAATAALEGCASIDYTLTQAQALPVDLLVEVDPDGAEGPLDFARATQAASEPGLAGVQGAPSSAAGRRQAFAWNTAADVPGVDAEVRLRVTPTARGVRGEPLVSAPLHVSNGPRFASSSSTNQVSITDNVVADMNRDGWPDVVTASSTGVTIRLGHDAGITTVPTGAIGLWHVAVGDFDGDGLRDLVIGAGDGLEMSLQQRTPRNSFAPFSRMGFAPAVRQMVVADFDRDGLDDLAVLKSGPPAVLVLRQRPAWGLDFDSIPWTGENAPGLAVGDLDRDGWPDLIVGPTSGPVAIVRRTAAGFEAPFTMDGLTGSVVAVADLDHDGFDDVAALGSDGLHVRSGKSQSLLNLPGISGTSLVLADLDGNGLTDIVVGDGSSIVLHAHSAERGALSFFPGRVVVTSAAPVGLLAVSDQDRDGRADVLACLGNGDITLYGNTTARRCDAGPSGPRGLDGESGSYYLFPDLNADGKPDLVARTWQMKVAFGRGDGTFAKGVPVQDVVPSDVAAGDFDHDGIDDLAFVDESRDVATILYNDPAAPGTLHPLEIPAIIFPAGMAFNDLDRDGVDDLLLMGSSRIDVHRGDPGAPRSFLPGESLPGTVETDPNSCRDRHGRCALEVHDLDGDGWPEIIAETGGNLRVFRPDAQHPGQFQDAILLERPESELLAVADVLGDAQREVLLLEHPSFTSSELVAYQLDAGAGTLVAAWSMPLERNYPEVAAVDLDGDGGDEIVVRMGETVTIFSARDVPSGSSLPTGRVIHMGGYGRLQFADLNGDARPDLVTDTSYSSYLVATGVAGAQTFDGGVLLSSIGAGSGHLAIGDFSGDTLPDLAAVAAGNLGVRLARQSSTHPGQLEPTELTLPGSTYVTLADLDGNGFADVVTEGTEGHMTFASHPDDVFTPECPLEPYLWPIAVGDLDGDGYPDIVGSGEMDALLLPSPAAGCRPATSAFSLPAQFPVAMDVVDMNDDGRLDVVTVIDGISVALQSTAAARTFAVADYEVYPSSQLTVRPYVEAHVADVDRDGWLDVVVVAAYPTTQLVVLRGNPSSPGTLLPAEVITGTNRGATVAVGDLDGDGWPDIALADESKIRLFVHDPALPGHFVYAYSLAGIGGLHGGSLSLVDFDRDGRQDLLVTSADVGTILLGGR